MKNIKDIFKSKKQLAAEREEREKKALDEQRTREFNAKVAINKALNNMKTQTKKLDETKNSFIEQARKSCLINDKKGYELAKKGLKACLKNQKFLESMTTTFEITLQNNEMNKLISEFVNGMNLVSEEMASLTSSFDITKAQSNFRDAIAHNANQNVALEAFIKDVTESMDTYDGDSSEDLDSEIDELINMYTVNCDTTIDDDIDKKINIIRNKINTK